MKKNLVNIQTQNINLEPEEYYVEKILNKRLVNDKVQYFLKWKGYSEEHNTWEPVENLNCKIMIKKFEDNLKQKEKENENLKEKSMKQKEKGNLKEEETVKKKTKGDLKQKENKTVKQKEKGNLKQKEYKNEQDQSPKLTRGYKRNLSNLTVEISDTTMSDFSNKRKKLSSPIKLKTVYKNKTEPKDNENNQIIKVPEKIIGATDANGQLMFLLQWKNITEADLVLAQTANIMCPQIVIKFYEERLVFNHQINVNT